MKRCPKCSRVFENDSEFCPHDAARLVAENFALPSDETDFEAETIVRREPFVVELFRGDKAPLENVIQPTPVENVIVRAAPPPPRNNSRNAALYLALGLLLGAILVLATLFLAKVYNADETANGNAKQVAVNVTEQNAKPKTPPIENRNVENKNATDVIANGKHDARTTAADEEFNGRVIALNAYVRASPSKSAAQTDVLPLNDRIHIERRENESSPWFYVTCEHGTSGWMHGDTIEFTRNY